MSGLKQLIQEVHRRSIWQVLGIYLGASWMALQVVEIMTQSVGLPDWVQPFAIVLLVIGFPIVLATAFVQEGMRGRPDSRQAAAAPVRSQSAPHASDDPESRPIAEPRPDETGAGAVEGPELQAGAIAAAAPERGTHHRIFTWRNALLGGVAAFAFLGVVTAGYMTMRTVGIGPAATLVAKGAIDERAVVILADFGSSDPLLARAATEAFRVDLSQSDVVRLAEPSFVARALRRMERPANGVLDAELAREIAQREGVGAVIAGEINPAGTGFVLTGQVLDPAEGTVLASHRETAADSSEILPAIDNLSKKLRERIGESYASIHADEPLERATTANLEALRLYSQAVDAADARADVPRAVALLEEALALDTAFAMAWRKLGVVLMNRQQQRTRALEALEMAYRHRDRLTKRERYFAAASYFQQGTREPEKAIPAYENLLEMDPEDDWALNNLGVAYTQLRNLDRSEEHYRLAVEADSASSSLPLSNLTGTLVGQGELEEAEGTLDTHRRLFPDDATAYRNGAVLASVRGDYEAAREGWEDLRERQTGNLFWRALTSGGLAAAAATQGRLEEAEGHWADAEAADVQRGLAAEALDDALESVWYDLLVRGDETQAAVRLRDALESYPLDEMPPLDRPYTQLASLTALSGQPGKAREILTQYEQEVPELIRKRSTSYRRALGSIAAAEARYEEAVAEFRRSDFGGCVFCALPGLADVYDRAGERDSAIAVRERYLATSSFFRTFWDSTVLGPALERLGQLYDEAGDRQKAVEYYAKFVELWRDADPELQPRVEAAQRRIDEIFAETG
ncbi:MAG: tetratricopeptide repeat protein [Gemmatimonadota bacterium]